MSENEKNKMKMKANKTTGRFTPILFKGSICARTSDFRIIFFCFYNFFCLYSGYAFL